MLHLLPQPQKESQLNLKTRNTQNCQKIDESPATKDLKKSHLSRRIGGAETWRWGREARRCDVAWKDDGSGRMGTGGPTFTRGR